MSTDGEGLKGISGVPPGVRRSGIDLIGESPGMRRLGGQIARAAASDATVLVIGESGTGKELVARALHALSKRQRQPFVAVNCAAMAETLLDSELFGHAKGAFTGAVRARRGLFEEADGGTLFIDEITETSSAFQAKLLRVLQEHEIRRLGESGSIRVDVRIVAATNQELSRAVSEQRFRKDLFYRLNVVPLAVPPLRERLEDVPLLARHFLERAGARLGRCFSLSDEAVEHLKAWNYPGNVRELENAIERAVALASTDQLGPADFPLTSIVAAGAGSAARSVTGAPTALVCPGEGIPPLGLSEALEMAERQIISAALSRSHGNLSAVAQELKISSTTLWRKMRRLGLSGPRAR